jgi:hypothetical protein
VRSADLAAALAEAVAPSASVSREPLPCRGLAAGPFSGEALHEHLSGLAVPGRTVALLTGDAGGLGPVDAAIVKWSHARTRALVAILRTGDVRVASYRPDMAALTGLGPGLTPTGDDLLVGMAAMARRLGDAGLVDARAAEVFAAALARLASAQTTPVALALLENASRGLYPLALATALERLGNPEAEPSAVEESVARLISIGAHSGADLLAGALMLALGVVFPKEAR